MTDTNGGFVLDTPEGINAFRLLSIRGRLKIELAGMRFRGRSTFAIVKEEFGFRGSKQRVFDQYNDMLRERGILRS